MFDEPAEEPSESLSDPKARAMEKAGEFRMHAEFAAVYEGPRKFEAQLIPGLDADIARELQKSMARLEKSKIEGTPVLAEHSAPEAMGVLTYAATHNLPEGDYHIHRREGEVLIVRWIAGEQVEAFYERLQAHFDAGLDGYRQEERQANAWRQDPPMVAYLDALDAIKLKMADMYLREPLKAHGIFVLSTQAADEMNIAYLADYVMGREAAEIVGDAMAPPENPSEGDLAWFYKLFSLRGVVEGVERMCFFTYLQKVDEYS